MGGGVTDYQKGDRIRATIEGVLDDTLAMVADDGAKHFGWNCGDNWELIERTDDPSNDPVGTRREMPAHDQSRGDSSALGPFAIRWDENDENPWVWFRWDGPQLLSNETVTGWPVVDPVPGTPAAEAEQREKSGGIATLREKIRREEIKQGLREPRVFLSDGPEPPEDVKALEWLDVQDPTQYPFLRRVGDGWLWSETATEQMPGLPAAPATWRGAVVSNDGRYREVLL